MAKDSKRTKRFLFLRATFEESTDLDNLTTLEEYIVQVYSNLKTAKERVVSYAGQTWVGTFFKKKNDCLFFQFSVATFGENATTLPTDDLDRESVELDTTAPPSGREFSEGDVICCVARNDIFTCQSLVRDSKIELYLRALFDKAGLSSRAQTLHVDKPANFDKIRMIKEIGVKSIRIKASLSDAQFMRLDDIHGRGPLKKLIRGLVCEDKKLVEAARDSEAQLKIEFNVPKKSIASGPQDWIETEALEAVDEGESYQIITNDGKVITSDEVTISKKERLERFGKSVFVDEAMRKLETFKNEFGLSYGTRKN